MKGIVFLFKYYWKEKKSFILLSVLMEIISAVTPLILTILPKFIIDELIGQRNIEKIITYILSLALVMLISDIVLAFLQKKTFVLSGEVFTEFQLFMAQQMASCDFQQLENPEFLDIKAKAHKFLYAGGRGFGVVLKDAFQIFGKVITFLGLTIIVWRLSPYVLLVYICIVLVTAWYDSKTKQRYAQMDINKAPIERRTNYMINLIEDFSYGKEIRLFHLQEWILKKAKKHFVASNNFYKEQLGIIEKSRIFSAFGNGVRNFVSYGFLCYSILRNTITLGDFSMYLSSCAQFSNAMTMVMDSIINIIQFNGYYDAVEQYINIPKLMRLGKNKDIEQGPYVIEFHNVSFQYPGQEWYALKNINLKINPGEKISVVGENGAGKTTLIKLLCRLYDPTDGYISINGVDIRDYKYDQYMNLIAPVFQDGKLFSFSIKENIIFNQLDEIEDGKVEKILERSGLKDLINRLPSRIHTNIYRDFDANGFQPSGGEFQKLELARALYKHSEFVILDEPTAALDPRSEYELYTKFRELTEGKTTIFISHRMSSSKFCDRVILLNNGKIVESGTHDDLMTLNSGYAEMYNMQAQYYN